MFANYEKMTIEMTKAEAKEAGKFNSEKYHELKQLRAENPTFRIVTINTRKKKSTFKGLDYNYMERYIKAHDDDKNTIMAEFNVMRGFVDGKKNEFVDCATYGEIKAWFLLKFPEIEEYNKKVEELRKATREANEAKKAS